MCCGKQAHLYTLASWRGFRLDFRYALITHGWAMCWWNADVTVLCLQAGKHASANAEL